METDDTTASGAMKELDDVTGPTQEGGDGERDALRRECDGLFDECRRRAAVAECAQERLARDLAEWERKRGWGVGATGPVRLYRPRRPLPLRDGLRTVLGRMIRKMYTPLRERPGCNTSGQPGPSDQRTHRPLSPG